MDSGIKGKKEIVDLMMGLMITIQITHVDGSCTIVIDFLGTSSVRREIAAKLQEVFSLNNN